MASKVLVGIRSPSFEDSGLVLPPGVALTLVKVPCQTKVSCLDNTRAYTRISISYESYRVRNELAVANIPNPNLTYTSVGDPLQGVSSVYVHTQRLGEPWIDTLDKYPCPSHRYLDLDSARTHVANDVPKIITDSNMEILVVAKVGRKTLFEKTFRLVSGTITPMGGKINALRGDMESIVTLSDLR